MNYYDKGILRYKFGVENKKIVQKVDGELVLCFDRIYDSSEEEILSKRYIMREDYELLKKNELQEFFRKKYILRQFFLENKFDVVKAEEFEEVFRFIPLVEYWRYIFLYQDLPFEYYLRNRRKADL